MAAGPFLAVLYVMVIDPIWEPDKRQEAILALDWPDVAEARSLEDQDRNARAAMAALGIDPERLLASAAAKRAAQEAPA